MSERHEAGQPACATGRALLDWDQVDWTRVQRTVERFQQKIFRDARAGNYRGVNQYQGLLVRSLAARLWAVKLVTEVNRGRNTPGVDGKLCKTSNEKRNLVESLWLSNYKASPVKVVWIPKPSGGLRRLGIPIIRDRAMQALVLLATDPEWEAKFEPHSFGFRPGRGAIDAAHHIFNTLMHQAGRRPHPGWVFDADISKCFDTIDHEALLAKLGRSPFKGTIRAWLKSGAISRVGFERTERGTPQGGVISPLLANIALDGLERQFGIYTRAGKYLPPSRRRGRDKDLAVFRYADDFIILAPSREVLLSCVIPKVKEFLATVGLSLNAAKTRVVNVRDGFEFLKFHFQRYYRRSGAIKALAFAPSRARLDQFLLRLKEYIRHSWNIDVKEFIRGLNRKIRGFCNYFKWSQAWAAFAYLNYRIWRLLWQWAQRRHYRRNAKWRKARYWTTEGKRKWVFSFEGVSLVNPYDLAVQWWKRPKVRILSSPYDSEAAEYWQARRQRRNCRQVVLATGSDSLSSYKGADW